VRELLAELEAKARARLPAAHYDYFAGGAGQEKTLLDNEAGFQRLSLMPRLLQGNLERNLRVELPGGPAALPLVVAPTGFHRLADPAGERATARAAARAGVPLLTGLAATVAVAEVTAAAREVDPAAKVWFQLYLQSAPGVQAELVRRAETAGCTALVVTADSPVFGRHRRDDQHGFHELPPGLRAANMVGLPGSADGDVRSIEMSARFTWEDIAALQAGTELPLWMKGILHPADVEPALNHGAQGLIVSNHGGRQLDRTPASIEALPAIVRAVAGRVPVLLDGGVRDGIDLALALALGATAVGIGRPVLWGLAAEGEAGVDRVLAAFTDDVDQVLTLCGATRPSDLTPSQVHRRGELT